VLFIADVNGFPVASLFCGLMIVDNPMSCIASDVWTPALLLFSPSFENDLHSGPDSSVLSVITNPHLPQKFSPVLASVTIDPLPHLGSCLLNYLF
jgi:hypothetical protein